MLVGYLTGVLATLIALNTGRIYKATKNTSTKKQINEEFNRIFYGLKIICEDDNAEVNFLYTLGNENYIEFVFELNENANVMDFIERTEDIAHKLDVPNLNIDSYKGEMYFTIRNTHKRVIPFTFHNTAPLEVPLGYNDFNSLICWRIDKDPHSIVAGASGSGKSTLIRSVIFHLVAKEAGELMLVDLKAGLEFSAFKHLRGVVGYADTVPDAVDVINSVGNECANRLHTLHACGCRDMSAYNEKFPDTPMKRLILIIDEFADLSHLKRQKGPNGPFDILISLSRKSRAVGIHMLLSTQRPSNRVLDPDLKSNFTALIGLRMPDIANSRIVIESAGLELLGVGESISFLEGNREEYRAMLLEGEELERLIAQYNVPEDKRVEFRNIELLYQDEDEGE